MGHSLLASQQRKNRGCIYISPHHTTPSTSLTQAVDADPLTWWQIHHLPFESEIIALFCTTHDPLPWGTYYLDAEVIELKRLVLGHGESNHNISRLV
jgi:hypothetical protein